jgi:predicted transcriptional regulator of viral defense system
MKYNDLISRYGKLPVIDTENLLVGGADPAVVRMQVSRWTRAGKLIQIKRGIYLLAPEYRRTELYEPYLASILEKPSYISMEKALEYHGLIPEGVPVYTSVTTKRPCRHISPAGTFDYRHINSRLFWGYYSITVRGQTAFMASCEKALLDLIYLKGMKISVEFLEEMRLQNIEKIDPEILGRYAAKFLKPGMVRAARLITEYLASRKGEDKTL